MAFRFELSPDSAQTNVAELRIQWRRSEDLIRHASPDGHEMLLNGKAPLPGQIMKFPSLARTFRALAEHGKNGFYRGRIAEAIVEVIRSKGGVMELEDLAKHASSFVEPIKYTYGGEVTVYEVKLTYPLEWLAVLKASCSVLRMDRVRTDHIRLGVDSYTSDTGRDHYAIGTRDSGEHPRARPDRQPPRNGTQFGRISSHSS